MAPPPLVVHAALLSVSLLFGLHFPLSKELLEEVPARVWVFVRLLAATVLLVPVAFAWGRRRPPRSTWGWLLLAALLGVVLNQVLFLEGLQRTTPAHSAVITTTIPIWTLVIAVIAGQETWTPRKGVAIGIALTGVLVLLEVDGMLAGGLRLDQTLIGDLLTLTNALSFSVYLVLMRRLNRHMDPLWATVVCFAMGLVVVGGWSAPAIDGGHWHALATPPVLWFAMYVVLGATVLTYLLNNWALQHAHSSMVALYIYVQPVVASTLSVAMGQDRFGWRLFTAMVLVFLGILVRNLPALRAPRPMGGSSS